MAVVTIISRASRTGTVQGTFNVPANATGLYWFRTNTNTADLTNPLFTATITMEVSSDGGTTWNDFCALEWSAVAVPWKGTGNPGFVVDASFLAGKRVRITIVLGRTTRIGFEVETP